MMKLRIEQAKRVVSLLVAMCVSAAPAFAIPQPRPDSPARTVFVQLFEWPWADIARECEAYLGPAGFAAVQVSPPHEHLSWQGTPWWERYQVISYRIDSRAGNEAEFRDMVSRCRKAGVDVYVDVVMNHMAGMGEGRGFAGSSFTQYNYPGIYGFDDFHHCGRNGNNDIVNFTDIYELYFCELVNLADLKTESPRVRQQLANYMNHLLDLGVTGFRIDAAKHMPAADIAAVKALLNRYAYFAQELIISGNEPLRYEDYVPVGDVTVFPIPFQIGRAFRWGDLGSLRFLGANLPSSESAITMLTNHDLERVRERSQLLSFDSDPRLYRLAQVFLLTWPYGYPQIYSGFRFSDYDQGPPVDAQLRTRPVLNDQGQCTPPFTCEHRMPEIAPMVLFRNETNDAFNAQNFWTDGFRQLAFSRGNKGFVAINASPQVMKKNLNTGLRAGRYCNLALMETTPPPQPTRPTSDASPNSFESTTANTRFTAFNNTAAPTGEGCSKVVNVDRSGRASLEIPPLSALVLLDHPDFANPWRSP